LNFRRVALFISMTTAAMAVFLLFPAAWSAVTSDGGFMPLACSLAAGLAMSAAFFFVGGGASLREMNTREAILSVAGSWFASSFITGLPYLFSGVVPNCLDALFEGVSGFTTTGATVLRALESVPRGILLWRSLSQWLGGIGIVVLTLAIFPVSAGMQLYKAEVTGPIHERLTPRIQQTASFLLKTYISLTLTELFLLAAGGLGAFDSLTLAFSTIATGGFSPYGDNVGHFAGSYVKWVTAIFLCLSATNLTVFHALIVKKSLSPLRENPELRFYGNTLIVFGAAVSLILYRDGIYATVRKSLEEGFFHTVSMLSTCGFFTTDYNLWPASARMLMLALMFCGGCAISTAGGMTCARVLVVLRHACAEFTRRLHPRAIVPTRVGEASVDPGLVLSCFAYFSAYIAVFAAGFLMLTLCGQDMTTAISGVAAALGNVGPGFGMAGPSEGYASVPSAVKAIYIFLMLCGRLELFTLLVLFTPKFWRG
jgi:trk system potassium uptake protein TrkH